MKKAILALLVIAEMTVSRSIIQGADYRVDQQHDWPNAFEAYHSIQGLAPINQEFTPAIGALDVVEIWTQDLGACGFAQACGCQVHKWPWSTTVYVGQGVPPLNYRIWGSINLRDWGEIGQVMSTTTNYAFTNLALGEPRMFFRVSQP